MFDDPQEQYSLRTTRPGPRSPRIVAADGSRDLSSETMGTSTSSQQPKGSPMFPVITVTGGPFQRGRQYGVQARERIHRSIAAYAQTFEYYAGWDWAKASAEALDFLPAIKDFDERYVEEMAGVADGADV